MNKTLPAIDDLLLRAQGLFYQERKARQIQDAKWRWVAIAIVGMFFLTFLVWLWVMELRASARMHYISAIQDAVKDLELRLEGTVGDLEVSLDDTKEIIQILIARDIQREEQLAALRLQIRMVPIPPK